MSFALKVFLSACLGVFSHLGFFIHGEHHLHSVKIMNIYIGLFVTTYCAETLREPDKFWKAQLNASVFVFSYASALFCSMFIYRMFLHPLHNFPGPKLAKVSKLWNVLKTLDSTNFRLMEDMHRIYGDFVRTGKQHAVRLMLVLLDKR